MKKSNELGLSLFVAGLLLPAAASAQAILTQRCTIDSLDPAQAEARLAWSRRCAISQHVASPSAGFDVGIASYNGMGNLIDYAEFAYSANPSGRNAYTGQVDYFEINSSVTNKLYLNGPTNQTLDSNGYWEWSRPLSRKKARPLYPTFGSTSNINSTSNKQLFPHPMLADCNFYLDRYGTQPATGYDFYINGYCEASCYTPEQKVLFSDGYQAMVDATASLREDLVTLAPDSTLDDIKLQVGRTYSFTEEIRDTNHPIVELTTASGGQVRVTVEHPVINGQGRIVAAQTLKVGDELVKADGTRDPIVEINRTFHYGKVYNLRPDATELVSHVLVAEGYLMGSSLFQNDEVGYMNRTLLFRHTPANLIP